ncbi:MULTISPECIES: rod shape-determining protein RodA [Pseudoalteromonas]|uniref:rod shape-determining protein RodA n=1 Tax=Pseudoalteromonas TaxID=53246 RepID=UPI0006C9F973|nr:MULTISPECIES: rod shape-determining protein RodA [Pseudoalteromonas]KPM79233.1 rod shape-determining protein RodA [Pseudoalteromonas sp. UCD-33C]KPZ74001.1 Rod shape-determining protein RodA [Pseudoalteromonas sp. P1-26]MCG9733945.1 rod shape-determining protein RodA [Pseudoalteromonas shioyasakiensis]MDK9682538.1 rod shape-determining protein RodA [Pseudoalteromonas shioyasakiensis]
MIPLNKKRSIWQRLHLDLPLLLALMTMMVASLAIVYSASGQDSAMMIRHATRMFGAILGMFILAQFSPNTLKSMVIPLYCVGLLMLVGVLLFGVSSKGAQRWLDLGVTRFQPSELMKIAVPMMVAWYIGRNHLPPRIIHLIIGFAIVMVPTILIKEQPDLGTSILIASSGIFVLFLSGLSWRLIGFLSAAVGLAAWPFWHYVMLDYQKQRVLTFLDPESDPLGSGYHIIQSKIAIGSGGIEGKGWLQGTQSQLEFLPERHTDFIFSVLSEEFGLFGVCLLLCMYLFIIGRGLYIAVNAQDAFGKLLAGALTLTFFVYVFVNIGMVSGLLPVVGVPLPLISYGGTSMVTLMAGFGIIMSIATDKRMLLK